MSALTGLNDKHAIGLVEGELQESSGVLSFKNPPTVLFFKTDGSKIDAGKAIDETKKNITSFGIDTNVTSLGGTVPPIITPALGTQLSKLKDLQDILNASVVVSDTNYKLINSANDNSNAIKNSFELKTAMDTVIANIKDIKVLLNDTNFTSAADSNDLTAAKTAADDAAKAADDAAKAADDAAKAANDPAAYALFGSIKTTNASLTSALSLLNQEIEKLIKISPSFGGKRKSRRRVPRNKRKRGGKNSRRHLYGPKPLFKPPM